MSSPADSEPCEIIAGTRALLAGATKERAIGEISATPEWADRK
jgi:hypothetical protein